VKKLEIDNPIKRGRKTEYFEQLLTFWKKCNMTLSFSDIVESAESKGITKRTVINYLNRLVKEGVLEKIVDADRNTYYRLTKTPNAYDKWLKAHIKGSIEEIEIYVSPNETTVLGILASLTSFFIMYMIAERQTSSLKKIIEVFKESVKETLELWESIENLEDAIKIIESLSRTY